MSNKWQVEAFKERFPDLDVRQSREGGLLASGLLYFKASHESCQEIADSYEVEIFVDRDYPASPPIVHETGQRIPSTFHHNPDGSLCLASRLRLAQITSKDPSIRGLVERLVIPFLFSYSYLESNGTLPYGELEHGTEGLLQDYQELFRLPDRTKTIETLKLLGMKWPKARRYLCPCGSGKLFGRCHGEWIRSSKLCPSMNLIRKEIVRVKKEIGVD